MIIFNMNIITPNIRFICLLELFASSNRFETVKNSYFTPFIMIESKIVCTNEYKCNLDYAQVIHNLCHYYLQTILHLINIKFRRWSTFVQFKLNIPI